MGCSASIIVKDNSPAFPTTSKTEDDKTLLSISHTPLSNESDSPHPKLCKGSEFYTKLRNNNKDETPSTSTTPITLTFTPAKSETLVTSAVDSGVSTPEANINEKDEYSLKVSLSTFSRRFSHESAERTAITLNKPSTFLREKVSVGDLSSVPSHSGLLSPRIEEIRRNSLGVSNKKPTVPAHKIVKKDRKPVRPMTVQPEEQQKPTLRKGPKTYLAPVETKDYTDSKGPFIKSPRSPMLSPNIQKGHRVTRSQGNMTPILVEGIVKEEYEAEEGENEENQNQKPGEAMKQLRKEKLKKQIQEKFRINLVNLYMSPRSKSSLNKKGKGFKSLNGSIRESPEDLIEQNTVSERAPAPSYQQDEILMKSVATENDTLTRIQSDSANASLKIPNFDMSIDESIGEKDEEPDSSGNRLKPHTPVKKSIFSHFSEEVGGDPSPINFGRRRVSQFSSLGFGFGLAPIQESKPSMPSLMVFDTKLLKRSDSSISSVRETRILDKSIDVDGQKRINQYIVGHELGRGSFGKVKLGIDSESGAKYAIKIADKGKLKKKLLARDKSLYSALQTEIAVMKKLSHPNIVQLHEVIDDPNVEKLYLVMDFIQRGAIMSTQYWNAEDKHVPKQLVRSNTELNGNLRMLFNQGHRRFSTLSKDKDEITNKLVEHNDNEKRALTEEKAKKYFRDLILGLDYMHNYANVIHRDIKPENLLIDENDTLKISDFNISCILEDNDANKGLVKSAAGTKVFLAPEAWIGSKFRGHPVDIWASGATLYYFLYGRPPFKSSNQHQLKELILNTEPEFPEEPAVNPKAIELIKACLRKNPDERITLEEIMEDDWITDDGAEPLINEGFEVIMVNEEDFTKAFTEHSKETLMIPVERKSHLGSARKSFLSRKTLDLSVLSTFREHFENSADREVGE